MNILFDLYTTQFFIGGGSEYIRRVFYALLDEIKEKHSEIHIVALIDTSLGKFAYKDLSPESLKENVIDIGDLKDSSLKEILVTKCIDKVFIGCAQYWGSFDIHNLNCPVVCVIHDLCNEEYDKNKIDEYVHLNNFKFLLRYKFHMLRHGKKHLKNIPLIIEQAKINPNFHIITVSNYSKDSIAYNFDYSSDKIEVLYSPERINIYKEEIDTPLLQKLLDSKKRYYLMLNANREMKNPNKAFHAFERYQELSGKDIYLVTTGCKESKFKRHIALPYLSDSDLVQVMKHCYALLFPSYFEGFGYPPLEAMSYGKPVLASNVTSMPEVLGEAPVYFSPFYETEIFRALSKLTEDNYECFVEKSKSQYAIIKKRQEVDLTRLISLILCGI